MMGHHALQIELDQSVLVLMKVYVVYHHTQNADGLEWLNLVASKSVLKTTLRVSITIGVYNTMAHKI